MRSAIGQSDRGYTARLRYRLDTQRRFSIISIISIVNRMRSAIGQSDRGYTARLSNRSNADTRIYNRQTVRNGVRVIINRPCRRIFIG